jgi:hypothetical protein
MTGGDRRGSSGPDIGGMPRYSDTSEKEFLACIGEWTHITGVPRIDGPTTPEKTSGDYTHGWVRSKYIQSFICPEDQEAGAPKTKPEVSQPASALPPLKPEDLPAVEQSDREPRHYVPDEPEWHPSDPRFRRKKPGQHLDKIESEPQHHEPDNPPKPALGKNSPGSDEILADWCKRNDPNLTAQSCIELKSSMPWPKWLYK